MMHTPNHRAILSTPSAHPASLGKQPDGASPSLKPKAEEQTDPYTLNSAQRHCVRRFLRTKPDISDVEHACAVLLGHGESGIKIVALCGLTGGELIDTLDSVRRRVDKNEQRLFSLRCANAMEKRKKASKK